MTYQDSTTDDASLTVNPQWRRSTFCASGSCVEVRTPGRGVDVRDSKDPQSPELHFDTYAWEAFIDAIKQKEITCP